VNNRLNIYIYIYIYIYIIIHICPYLSKNATSTPRDEESSDDVFHPYFSINLALGIILGIVFLSTTDIPHHGELRIPMNAFLI